MQAFFPNKIKIASLSYRERPKKVPYGRQHPSGLVKHVDDGKLRIKFGANRA
jgi:hypothetical protein